EHRGSFGEREAVAPGIERHCADTAEAAAAVMADERLEAELLGASGEDRVGPAAANEVGGIGQGEEARRLTSRHRRVDAAQVVPDGGLPRRGVDHAVGEVHGARVGGTELERAAVELGDRAHAAEGGAEDEADLLPGAPFGGPAGGLERLL